MIHHSLLLSVLLTMTLTSAIAAGQHEGHHATNSQDATEIAQCARVAPLVDNIITAAIARGESARQWNRPSDMRAALDHLEAALRDIQVQLEPCKTAATSADSHGGHTMPGMQAPGGSAQDVLFQLRAIAEGVFGEPDEVREERSMKLCEEIPCPGMYHRARVRCTCCGPPLADLSGQTPAAQSAHCPFLVCIRYSYLRRV
jgi:hypothetical protein